MTNCAEATQGNIEKKTSGSINASNFTNNLLKQLAGREGDCLPHTCLGLLHAYHKATEYRSLLKEDQYFITTAAFFIATKLTSVHIQSAQLLEVFYSLRLKIASQEEKPLSIQL
jgi:hypothetical protein